MQTILAWLVGFLLDYLKKWALDEATKLADQMAEDKKRGQIDDKNVQAYADAQTRADKIAQATNLLNGT